MFPFFILLYLSTFHIYFYLISFCRQRAPNCRKICGPIWLLWKVLYLSNDFCFVLWVIILYVHLFSLLLLFFLLFNSDARVLQTCAWVPSWYVWTRVVWQRWNGLCCRGSCFIYFIIIAVNNCVGKTVLICYTFFLISVLFSSHLVFFCFYNIFVVCL